jgi:hypothetical protein
MAKSKRAAAVMNCDRGRSLVIDLRSTLRAEGAAMDEALDWYSFQVLHPYFGYTLDPTRTPFPTDEFGFANRRPPISPGPSTGLRVGVMGGSVAMFLAAKYGHILGEEVGSALSRPTESVEIINLAQGGFKQPQQAMVLSLMLALGAKFDVIINLDGFNEVALHPCENGTKEVDLSYPRNWYFAVDPFKSSAERLLAARIDLQRERMRALDLKLERRSFPPARAIIRLITRVAARKIQMLEDEFRQSTFPDLSYQTKGRGRTYSTDDEMFRQLVAIWKNSSALLDDICGARCIRYYHFLQPNQYFPGTKQLTLEERALFYHEGHPYRFGAENGYPYLVQACEELRALGIRAFDVSGIFRDVHETMYADACCHLNEVGSRRVSQQIASTMREHQKSG